MTNFSKMLNYRAYKSKLIVLLRWRHGAGMKQMSV